ncbi:DJ-1/PfpI family protein [Pseudonocardia zijingensis]|uniref:DJ-1/PfpI family protein n=1 Tax=Pseudonocardia zijingensis TaxID=153376 RepID=A0ABP4AEF6_9PSEU
MKIAIPLYDRFTSLDAVGPYEALSRLPGAETVIVAERTGPVPDTVGSLSVVATATFDEVTDPDVVVVPGGPGQRHQMSDGPLHRWLRAVDAHTTWTTSVCTGSLILAAAGLLRGRRATSHWLAVDQLAEYGVTAVADRVVVDGKYVTSAGVSAGIDMALGLAERIAGERTAQEIQLMMEYDPDPPHDAGSREKAPAAVVEQLLAQREQRLAGARPATPAVAEGALS